MAHCNSRPKKMKQGGVALNESGRTISDADRRKMLSESGRTMSDNDRRMLDQMLKRERAAKKARENMMRREVGRDNMTQSDMDYIEKGPKFFKNGGCVMSGRGGKFKGVS